MCGIFLSVGSNFVGVTYEKLKESGYLAKSRGPDNSCEMTFPLGNKLVYALFHRLSIHGLSSSGNQPMILDNYPNTVLLCNGEIYNYKELAEEYNIDLNTGSDCEIIIHLYHILGIEECISLLDGVFSFVIINKHTQEITIGHDPIGVRSLYWSYENDHLLVSSEMKQLVVFGNKVNMYPPGSYTVISDGHCNTKEYFSLPVNRPLESYRDTNMYDLLYRKLRNAVEKRIDSERPIGCFLSGGIDSSIIAYLVKDIIHPRKLETFSIGFEGSKDLEYAKLVSQHLDSNHNEYVITEEEMLNAIPDTIYQIESYDTTTVRASVPMFLLSKYISRDTDIKVMFSGEGADEIFGSYLYFHNAPDEESFQNETVRLLRDIQYFDVLRGDKTTAGNGLEIRVPFLDKEFVRTCVEIHPEMKMIKYDDNIPYEKYLLRKTFEEYLPNEIIWRRKDGFSDSVSGERMWCDIIKEYADKNIHNINDRSMSNENKLYLSLFRQWYEGYEYLIPYYWMPKWSEIDDDPSGRLILGE
jgi:asparagine synthase (glutamine-hydrolysing)